MNDPYRPAYDFPLDGLGSDPGSRGRVFRAIPVGSRVLDVGCDTGRFGAALRQERQCEVEGIERDPASAREAARRLDRVHERSVDSEDSLTGFADFDAVLFLDVLEHLYDPWAVLRGARQVLKKGGAIYAVVPNVAHVSVVRRLAQGRFEYEGHGTMDRTHIRWFTRQSFARALGDAGFEAADVDVVPVVPWIQELPRVGQRLAEQLARCFPDQLGGSLLGIARRP